MSVLCTGVAACGGRNLELSVKDQWTKNVRNFALRAVYPMREDVFIGTVRLTTDADEPYGLTSRSFGYIDLQAVLAREVGPLPNFPKTPAGNTTSTDNSGNVSISSWAQPTIPGPNTEIERTRLRSAALPGISMARLTSADIASNSPLKILTGAFQENANLNISLDVIETAELDQVTARRVFSTAFINRLYRDPDFRNAICGTTSDLGGDALENAKMEMISRVFYARVINYSYGANASAALRAATGLAAVNQGAVTADSLPTTTPQPEAGAQATDPATTTSGRLGGISSSASEALSQNEVFERPMAFGVESIAFSPYDLGLRCVTDAVNLQGGSAFAQGSYLDLNRAQYSNLPAMSSWQYTGSATSAPASRTALVPPTAPPNETPFSSFGCPENSEDLSPDEKQFLGC